MYKLWDTPLLHACETGNRIAVETATGAEVNAEWNGYTPLMVASERNHPKVVKQLLEKGATLKSTKACAPPNWKPHAWNAMHVAADLENTEALEILIDAFPGSLDMVNGKGDTALCLAASEGHVKAVMLLVANGANAHAGSHTALHYARDGGFKKIEHILRSDPGPWRRAEQAKRRFLCKAKEGMTEKELMKLWCDAFRI